MQMCSSPGNLRFAEFASAAVLALAWHVAGAAAQLTPPAPETKSAPLIAWSVGEEQPSAAASWSVRQDRSVSPAIYSETEPQAKQAAAVASDPRHLAPQSEASAILRGKEPANRDSLPFSLPRIESFTTAATGLAIVVGLFLVCAWLMRRSGPKPTTPLPREAVAVLGRVPLAASHFAHLLQLGNKLVLVSVGPDSVTSLAEVTDPAEVHRLLSLCMRNHKHSTTAEFHQVLEELANEPARGFLGDQASRGVARAGRS
ncbi:MAG: FliO/MopB family protein [Planctomycetes bacterium]|nr:FliO/MopB family protein [Planctomycetota bacterium]